jgi:AraC-like DNA-binding protein
MTIAARSSADLALTLPRRPIAGIGRICVWNGASVWIGRSAGQAKPHAHHAIQISIALDGEFDLRQAGTRSTESHARAALVPPDLRHHFDGLGATVAQVFIEPESRLGRALLAHFAPDHITALEDGDAQMLRSALHPPYTRGAVDGELAEAAQRALADVAGTVASKPIDKRVLAVIDWLRGRPDAHLSLAQAAALAHLSPSRFRHLFVAETGTTYRAWLLWLRLNTAVQSAMAGATWTDAAHAAGFADSSHLSRSFRRTFGVVPAMLVVEKEPPRA